MFIAILEPIGGILINSISIIADAFNDFADNIGLAKLLEKFSGKTNFQNFVRL